MYDSFSNKERMASDLAMSSKGQNVIYGRYHTATRGAQRITVTVTAAIMI
jgi:ABC-type uncharacterized transport system ATPase subunit